MYNINRQKIVRPYVTNDFEKKLEIKISITSLYSFLFQLNKFSTELI